LCADCNGKCNPENVKIKIQAGDLNGLSGTNVIDVPMAQGKNAATVDVPEGKLDYGIFIEVSYLCKEKGNPRNPCEEAKCSDVFVLRLKRPLACDCGDVQFAVTLDHKPKVGRKKSDDLNLGEGNVKDSNGEDERKVVPEVEWPDAVGKGDAITLKMKSLTAKCQGCNDTCKPENIKIAVSGSNITTLKTKEDAVKSAKSYTADMPLITAKKVTGDNGDVFCTITVLFDCTGSGADCAPKKCSKDYTIKFKR
jgi:hypothetical protein